MKKYDFAASMEENIQNNKQIFSSSATLEKLAFSKVSDDKVLEKTIVETTVAKDDDKACEVCKCTDDGCKCMKTEANLETVLIKKAYAALIEASESLDAVGMETLAEQSLALLNGLIVEAKAKKKKKDSKKSDKKDSKKDSKKTDKKSTEKDSKKSEKDSKKSDKKSSK